MTLEGYSEDLGTQLGNYFGLYKRHYQQIYNENSAIIEKKMAFVEKNGRKVADEKNRYRNESLADLVQNVTVKDRWLEYKGRIIQQINPIFQTPDTGRPLNYRAAFFLPQKNLFGSAVDTFWFNLGVVWAMSLVCYIALYFELFRLLVNPVRGRRAGR